MGVPPLRPATAGSKEERLGETHLMIHIVEGDFVCMCVCVYIYICMYVCVCVCVYIYIYIYIYYIYIYDKCLFKSRVDLDVPGI